MWAAHQDVKTALTGRVHRNLVKRFFNELKLKHFRAVATRHDKNPENYLAAIKLASARIWMRANESIA